jgi:predicted DNA-binding protein
MVKKTISKKTDRGSEQFQLRLPDGMRERLARVAERQGHTMNAVIVTALARYFENEDAGMDAALKGLGDLKGMVDQLAAQQLELVELLRKK